MCWYSAANEDYSFDDAVPLQNSTIIPPEDRDLLIRYHHGFDDDKVDFDLIVCLLYKLHSQQQEGII
jgi:hypothetical protein